MLLMNSKESVKKTMAVVLSLVLLMSCIGATVYAVNTDKPKKEADTPTPAAVADKKPDPQEEDAVKDETVYVLANADGSVKKVIVSDWIKNTLGSATISDRSELVDVENVKGDESYKMDKDNMRVWDAQGNDIYYQGNIEKELPVALSVSYKLDGKSISAADLAGKSGKVTIRFDYQNNQYEMVEIDGKQEKMYVPFVMMTGMVLDTDVFTNVEVTNGKLMNDGSRITVAGIAFPGLQSNLNVEKEKMEIPEYVEIRADVKNFKMTNTVTIATNEILNRLDLEEVDSEEALADSLNSLTDGMTQLLDGSSQLYEGLSTLLDKSGELVDGIGQLADGSGKLKDGAGQLDSGAAELTDGAQELASGLGQLTANNATLISGSEQVFRSLLNMANTQLKAAGLDLPELTIGNYADVLSGVVSSLDPDHIADQAYATALEKVTDMVNANRDTVVEMVTAAVKEQVTAGVTEAVRANVEAQVLEAMGLTKETYEAGVADGSISSEQQAQIEGAIGQQMESEKIKETIQANVEEKMQSEEMQGTIAAATEQKIAGLIEENMNSDEVQEQITAALGQAQSGVASIASLKAQLDSYNTFYRGLAQYTQGVASAKDGADQLSAGAVQLKSGTSELYAGTKELDDGVHTLKDNAPALIDGVTALRDGGMRLSDGLKEFHEKGIQKLVEAVDGDIGSLIARFKGMVEVSRDYKSFSGISEDMSGQVKFIYRTDSVEQK